MEARNIKDYLHLYLGCEGGIRHGEIVKLTTQVLHQSLNPKSGMDFKPILRPLSDMTEEEHEEWKAIKFNDDFKLKPLYTDADYNSFVWLLKKGFDLFDLIPEGLAIGNTQSNNSKTDKK